MPLVILLLLGILAISALTSWWISGRKSTDKPVRVMIFVGYFWLLTFVQIVLVVAGYLLWQRLEIV